MRIIILSLLFLLLFDCKSQNIDPSTITAINYMYEGYLQYGIAQLEQATKANDISAQFYMGNCYEFGIGVQQDHNLAFRLYRKAAERGLPDAMIQLSNCYQKGLGVIADSSKSAEWYKRYMSKGGKRLLPEFQLIYSNASHHPERFSVNPNLSNNTSTASSVDNPIAGTVNHITIIQNSTNMNNDIAREIPVNKEVKNPRTESESDIDINIPISDTVHSNTFALIIANENYQEAESVPNAIRDGDSFYQYCEKTFGLPTENIHYIKNATLNNIKREINLMKKICEAYDRDVNLIVFYAGHGLPDETSKDAYLLPVDGYVSDMESCFKMNDLYSSLGNLTSSKVIVFIDACFSGSKRGDGMLSTSRGVVLKSKRPCVSGNMVVFSAAQADETAYSYNKQRHGLFTYFVLKKIQDTKGNVLLKELTDYVKNNVLKTSLVVNGKSQTPSVNSSPALLNNWESWKLIN